MSVVTELEAALQAMQNSKAPGVSGSKIVFITELSVNNVQVHPPEIAAPWRAVAVEYVQMALTGLVR